MKNNISYRQKLIALAKIYKIDSILNTNIKFTTYEIELLLLKNNVPIPSRRGYLSHKIINEIWEPVRQKISTAFETVNKLNKLFNHFNNSLKEKLTVNFNIKKNPKKIFNKFINLTTENLSINFNVSKNLKKLLNNINNYFKFITLGVNNFFKILTKTIIGSLNDIYNFKIEEKLIKKFILRGIYAFLAVLLVTSTFYIKRLITDVNDLKISVEIKSDKKIIAKSKESNKKSKSKDVVKKLDVSKKPYDPETDYTLNTQTVLNLFKDLEYDLDRVRNKKLVKPIYFTRLPKDLNKMKSVTQKKETFLKILLPLVVAENENILKDRRYLIKILKQNQSEKNTNWINKKYKEYRVSKKNIDELIEKIDIIPTSIALAQAAKESGWGTSRFALEGNAIFGQWTWNGAGIEPLDKTEGQNHKILKFPLLRASVKAYITNLNTHSGYKNFRKKRLELRNENKNLSGLDLIHELENYAQTGKEYTRILEKIIKQNNLDEFETVTINDFKENKELKL